MHAQYCDAHQDSYCLQDWSELLSYGQIIDYFFLHWLACNAMHETLYHLSDWILLCLCYTLTNKPRIRGAHLDDGQFPKRAGIASLHSGRRHSLFHCSWYQLFCVRTIPLSWNRSFQVTLPHKPYTVFEFLSCLKGSCLYMSIMHCMTRECWKETLIRNAKTNNEHVEVWECLYTRVRDMNSRGEALKTNNIEPYVYPRGIVCFSICISSDECVNRVYKMALCTIFTWVTFAVQSRCWKWALLCFFQTPQQGWVACPGVTQAKVWKASVPPLINSKGSTENEFHTGEDHTKCQEQHWRIEPEGWRTDSIHGRKAELNSRECTPNLVRQRC